MGMQDSFERMASEISPEERMRILEQVRPEDGQTASPLHPANELFEEYTEPLETKIKKESLILRIYIWIKAALTNTKQSIIYNEYKLSELSRYVHHNFPGIVNTKHGLLLTPFYEHLNELKEFSDFIRPYIFALNDNNSSFYVFLAHFIMPAISEEIKTNADPYSNPVTADFPPDTRTQLLHKLEDIFDNIPAQDRAQMYNAAKATEWLKNFVRLPFPRLITQFSENDPRNYTCPFGQIEPDFDVFASVLCSAVDIPDEFTEALYLYAMKNSKNASNDETGRDAAEFLTKAHSYLSSLQMFMTSIPLRSIGRLIHIDSQWQPELIFGGEDWYVKYKNVCKKIFEQKWAAWESDCKKQALLSTLKFNFDLESFPQFPERPWEEVWTGNEFAYTSTLGFVNWFMRERFINCEMDLKTLLTQGTFNKSENFNMLSDAFNAMIQLAISFQDLERKLSVHGEWGAFFYMAKEEGARTIQTQNKLDKIMREIEADSKTFIHKFGDNARVINQVLAGILGYTKDARYDTVSNLQKIYTKNNEPFVRKLEAIKTLFENSIAFAMELESLDKQKAR
ncbi:DUF5312 family protein [uncultured Treponema sp.]|uniref:DUF5312 family protein n=1 Tax=uncultured Treponema sp. TaxID=162155 RepID=UPI0025DF1913|nr:DUF5312 family protein [uncultured Treponema sp.]